MTEINEKSKGHSLTPFGKVFRLKELPGRLRKRLIVPQDRLGIVLDGEDQVHYYEPGQHTILFFFQRLLGKGAGVRAGYITRDSINLRLKTANLLSGDENLVDASLLCCVSIEDPLRFFTEFVIPNREVSEEVLDLDENLVRSALQSVIRDYSAEDLARQSISERISVEFTFQLKPVLKAQGLILNELYLLTFWPAEDRVIIAEKMLDLEEKLSDVALQEQMAKIENRLQLDEFLQNVSPQLAQEMGLNLLQAQENQKSETRKFLRTWVTAETENKGAGLNRKVKTFFERFGKKKEETQPEKRRKPRRWWLKRSIWIGFILFISLLITFIARKFSSGVGIFDSAEFYFGLWGFAILGVLESIKVLYERWEEINEANWALEGVTYLDDLTGKDRQRVDALVREQCGQELGHIFSTLEELRHKVYNPKTPELALQLKSLGEKLASIRDDVQNPEFGKPPYLKDLKISRNAWEALLDNDEQVIIQATALGEDAQVLMQTETQGKFDSQKLRAFEAKLEAFRHIFASRGRSLHAPQKDQQKYRIANKD